MARTALALALILLAGCQTVLGLDHVPDAPAFTPCADRAPSLLCADFDEATPAAYVGGIETSLPAANQGVTFALRGPAVSKPAALWVDSPSGTWELDGTAGGAPTKIVATFALQVTSSPGQDYELVRVGLDRDNHAACSAFAQIGGGGSAVKLMAICDGMRDTATVLSQVPVGWFDVSLELDAAAKTATMAVDSVASGSLDLSGYTPSAGPPIASAGAVNVPSGRFGIDNLVVTVAP